MQPIIALVGRPNVGKSTLFNALTRTRQALVYDMPGVTRDRQYGHARLGDLPVILIDTGGIQIAENDMEASMMAQVQLAIEEADVLLFLVDARFGVHPDDQDVAKQLRQTGKPVILVANKTDGLDADVASSEFYAMGLGAPVPIAASHRRGLQALSDVVFAALPEESAQNVDLNDESIKVAIVGRPNAGKSTLVNRILGEERVVVLDMPGTTRDSIYIPFTHQKQAYTLIDTAGVRRRGKVTEVVEKFSVSKTLKAIEDAHVVVYLLDAQREVSEQDLHLLDFTVQAGRCLVLAVNKWDHLSGEQRDKIKRDIDRRLGFVGFAEQYFISALHGTNVGCLFKAIKATYHAAMQKLSTSQLTDTLKLATQQHQPPISGKFRIKLRYAHSGGHNPQIIVLHGKQTEKLADSYKRYLVGFFRKRFKLEGCPIRLLFHTDDNPFV